MDQVYDGFISYSHAADDLLAPRLQSALQRFAKPWWKRRAVRIFRDESSLSANPHLWSSITEALDTSGWFVLLLSPDAASSEWVNQEIAYWVEHRDPKKILPVVTDGDFGWADGDVSGNAAPEALRDVFKEEPRWVDLRGIDTETELDLQNPEFAAAVADIASTIRGIPKDELASEEVRQHRRTVRTAWTAGISLALLAIAAVAAGIFAIGQRNNARAEALAANATAQLPVDPELAILLALESLDVAGAGQATATTTLIQALIDDRTIQLFPRGDRPAPMPTHVASLDGSRVAVVGWTQGDVTLYDVETGDQLWRVQGVGESHLVGGVFTSRGDLLYVLDSAWTEEGGADVGTVYVLDAATGDIVEQVDVGQCPLGLYPGPSDGNTLLITRSAVHTDGRSCNAFEAVSGLLDLATGDVTDLAPFQYPFGPQGEPTITRNGRLLAVGDVRGVRVVDAESAEVLHRFDDHRFISTMNGSGSKILLGGAVVELRDLDTGDLLATYPVQDSVDARFLAGGGVLISSAAGAVHVFDEFGRQLVELAGHRSLVSGIAAALRSPTVVSEAGDGVRVWDIGTLNEVRALGLSVPGRPEDVGDPGRLAVGGAFILVPYHKTGVDHRYVVFDRDGRVVRESGPVGSFALSPDGTFVVQERWTPGLFTSDGGPAGRLEAIEVVDTVTGDLRVELDACSYLMDWQTLEATPEGDCSQPIVTSDMEVSADSGRVAVVGYWWNSAVWDTSTGERVWQSEPIDAPFIWAHQVGLSPRGEHLLTLDLAGGGYRAVSLSSGEITDTFGGTAGGAGMVFHPREPVAFIAESPGDLLVVDTADWNVRSKYSRPGAGFRDVALSPDGSTITVISDDGLLLSWDWRTDTLVQEIDLAAPLFHVAYLDDAPLVVDPDGNATTIPIEWDSLRSIALERLTRSFTTTECATYGIDPCPTLEEMRGG